MHLNQTVIYALRAMSYLAVVPLGQPIPSRSLSKATDIPVHYLSKIMRKMVTAGLVISQKGHGGGFTLAKLPADINMLEILQTMDYDPESQPCAFGWECCDAEKPCPLHHYWSQLKSSLLEWSEITTLAELREKYNLHSRNEDS